jgi:hypothetical protein
MSKHVSTFISKMVVHFGEPKFDVADSDKAWAHREWLREMMSHLGDYEQEVLERAASSIAATRKHRNFPLISECKAACYEARRWLAEQKPALPMKSVVGAHEMSEERAALARDLIRGDMGRQAAREGWIWGLYQFCLRNARLPERGKEINEIKEAAAGVLIDMESAARGEMGSLSKCVYDLGATLLKKRDAMRDFVLHGVMP